MLLVNACSAQHSAPAHSPSPANSFLSATVTTANLNTVKRQVAASSLSASQKTAFLDMVRQHSGKPAALNGKTVGEMIAEEHAYVMALRMSAAARAADRAHRLQMNALLSASASIAGMRDASVTIALALHNKTQRTIEFLDCGIEVRDARGTRLGLAEFEIHHKIAPHASVRIAVGLPYAKFGGDAVTVRNAPRKGTYIVLDVIELRYVGGSVAGAGD